MMRKFKIMNGEGKSFDLNSKESFFHSIGGFGYTDSTQFKQIGTDFIPLEEMFSQGELNGSIFFGGIKAYQNYREFTRFVRSTPLTLIYQPDEEFRVPIRLLQIEKGELMEGGIGLNCEVSFIVTGLFYRSITKNSDTLYIGGKIYPYVYSYAYADISQNTLLIDSDSYVDSPCRISIYGPCVNPVWKHYVDNVLYETGAYSGTIPDGRKLVIDTTTMPYSITERGSGDEIVADRYQMCDFTTERFFLLKHGSNRISVVHDGLNSINMTVEGKISYETV